MSSLSSCMSQSSCWFWRNSVGDKNVGEGFLSEPCHNVLLWETGFVSKHFTSKESALMCLGLCTSSRNTPPTAPPLPDSLGFQLEMYSHGTLCWHLIRLGFGYWLTSDKYLTQRTVYLAVACCFGLPEPAGVCGLMKSFFFFCYSHITQDSIIGLV